MDQVSTIGLDIAKNVFQVHGIDETGAVVVRRQLRRSQVLAFFGTFARLFAEWVSLLGLELKHQLIGLRRLALPLRHTIVTLETHHA